MKRIAIIGGGPGGLFTALMLAQRSSEALAVTLFEADRRLGGKVVTKRFAAAPIEFEAGTAELYRYGDDPLWLLVTRYLGLPIVEMHGNTVVFDGHLLQDEADIRRYYGVETLRAMRRFHARARAARPFRAFYNSGWLPDNRHPWQKVRMHDLLAEVTDDAARRLLQVVIHSDLATEPHLTNGLYGVDNYLINDPRYCQLYSVRGGLERLTRALAERLIAEVRLGARVTAVDKNGGDGYRLAFVHDGQAHAEAFDVVLVALPLYALRQIAWGGPLRAAMGRHFERYDRAAHYLRITALFREPFWRGSFDGSYFLHDAFGGCCVYDEGTKHDAGEHGVLSWLIAGSDALALTGASDDALLERALESLPAPMRRGRAPREQLLEAHVHRWLGTVSGEPGGNPIETARRKHCPEPRDHRGVLVVGDYLFDTTINAALDSAEVAVELTLEHLKIAPAVRGIDYFDYYRANRRYGDSFMLAFDPGGVLAMLRAVFGAEPPYCLLDAGSASGLTLAAFQRMGVDAWGIENSWYIHAQTPEGLQGRNLLGDVCAMPFADEQFDFVYETCLSQLPPARLGDALRELYRVTRRGLMLGSVFDDAVAPPRRRGLFGSADDGPGAEALSEGLQAAGFRPALADPAIQGSVWEAVADALPGHVSRQQFIRCFYYK